MNAFIALCLLAYCFLSAGTSSAFETKGQDCTKCHSLTAAEATELIKGIAPDIKVLEIRLSPSKPLWEVFAESRSRKMLLYVDLSKRYLFSGSLFSLKDKRNLSQESFSALNRVDVSKIPLNDALVLGDTKARLRVVVFTDPD
ncbi:MAG: protein disulfide bond isomerase, DsbC/DsbG-like protein [Deltaproteobacteria bacterium]|jgi:thiol:disulfide interchange protein DsbC|nr:protein disulfide bond isomerase, DsbC/DsbG-like protein [Deltaproteobacteria bacterium]